MKILQRSNYIIYFDDVRVDQYVVNWNANLGLFANDASANIVLYRTDHMDKWKGYLTQVKIFGENPFTKKFTMLFDGEIMNRSWTQNKRNMGTVTFHAKGYYHWLDIPVPLGISNDDAMNTFSKFIYQAQGIDIEEVRYLIMNQADLLAKDKNIEEIIQHLFEKLTLGYYEATESDTAFHFADVKNRFRVMVDVLEEFTQAGFLDLFTHTNATQIESFFVFLNDVLSQLMFEFYQDRDGSFRIKTPSWADPVLKAHTIDASIVDSISGMDDWEHEPTRVLAIGAATQLMSMGGYGGTGAEDSNMALHVPIGLYIGDPRQPETEEYYSTMIQQQIGEYGSSSFDSGNSGDSSDLGDVDSFSGKDWFDNITGGKHRRGSGHRTVNSKRPDHRGTDLGFVYEPVYSIGTHAIVTHCPEEMSTSAGWWVGVEQVINGQLYAFRYLHFVSRPIVRVGQAIKPGQRLGTSGNTGNSEGPHLHLEIWKGKWVHGGWHDVEPLAFLKKHTAAVAAGSMSNNKHLPGKGQQDPGGATVTPDKLPAPKKTSEPIGAGEASASGVTSPLSPGGPKITANASGVPQFDKVPGSWQTFVLTSYDALCSPLTINGRHYQGCSGITATGVNVKNQKVNHRIIAVDKNVIPLHSIVEIEGLGMFSALDTGGAIKGNRIDVLATSKQEALNFGKKSMKIRIMRRGKGASGLRMAPNASGAGSPISAPSGSASLSGVVSNPYSNTDNFLQNKTNKYSKQYVTEGAKKKAEKEQAQVKPVKPSTNLTYSVPSSSYELTNTIKNNSGKIDPNLVASIIKTQSGWKEKHQSESSLGIMGVPTKYADEVLKGQNVMEPNNSINFGSDFMRKALDRFSGKITFALAAYHLGSLSAVEAITKQIGTLNFEKGRNKFDAATLAFIDSVIGTYTSSRNGDFIEGDPHKDFGERYKGNQKKPGQPLDLDEYESNASTEYEELPDYEEFTRPKMSDEEKKYKINFKRVEQALIRNDSPSVEGNMDVADKLIYQFAKYNMQLERARTHNINISLTTCLPFLRPGLNAWIEPTRTDVVCYITSISHSGSFGEGCVSNINGGFVRSPDDYQEVDSSIFIGETKANSETFGEIVTETGMDTIRAELNSMHGRGFVAESQNYEPLRKLYSTMNEDNDFSTTWNKEYTADELVAKMTELFKDAPNVVKERSKEISSIIEKSKDTFLKFLSFTLHN